MKIRKSYKHKNIRAEYSESKDAMFEASAENEETGESREHKFSDETLAHNFCLAAVDTKHANHRRVWGPIRRPTYEMARDARVRFARSSKIKKSTENHTRFVAGFCAGVRDAEKGEMTRPLNYDNSIWIQGYKAGQVDEHVRQGYDARLSRIAFLPLDQHKTAGEACETMREDCIALLDGLKRHVAAYGRKSEWGYAGSLAKLRAELRDEAAAFGLIEEFDPMRPILSVVSADGRRVRCTIPESKPSPIAVGDTVRIIDDDVDVGCVESITGDVVRVAWKFAKTTYDEAMDDLVKVEKGEAR